VAQGIDRPSAARAEGRDRVAWALLGAALFLGLLRFAGLSRWSLWLDEALTLADARHRTEIDNPIGYWIFGWVFAAFEGRPDELVLRLPAALCGYLAIPLTWWAFAPIVARRVAAAAALALALSSWHLYWSQTARFYTLAQVLGLLGAGLLVRGILLWSTWRTGFGLLLAALAALAHPSAALLLGGLCLASWTGKLLGLFEEPDPALRAGRGPWHVLDVAGFVALFAGVGWVVEVWLTWSARQGRANTLHLILSAGFLITPFLGSAFLVGLWRAWSRRDPGGLLIALIVAFTLLGALLASFFVRVSAQYVFVLLPWIAALSMLPFDPADAAFGASGAAWRRRAAFAALVLLPMLVDSATYFAVRHGDRPRWREAYRYVADHRRNGDLILGMEAPVGEYYLDPTADDLRHWRAVAWLDSWRADLVQRWSRYPRRAWLIVNHEQLQDWGASQRVELEHTLREDCTLVEVFDVPFTPRDLDVSVYLYE
jgi:hypothetical protein